MMKFTITDLAGWDKIADKLIEIKEHNILLLKGDLGAGKTTFSKILLKKMGIEKEVSSPTYSIVNEYDAAGGKVYHFDLYRLKNTAEAEDIGIYEYLENGAFCLIEWPDILEEELQHYPHHTLSIENNSGIRTVIFS